MYFDKKASALTLEEIWSIALEAVSTEEGCSFRVKEGNAKLKARGCSLVLSNFYTGECWERKYPERPSAMTAVELLAYVLLTW